MKTTLALMTTSRLWFTAMLPLCTITWTGHVWLHAAGIARGKQLVLEFGSQCRCCYYFILYLLYVRSRPLFPLFTRITHAVAASDYGRRMQQQKQ